MDGELKRMANVTTKMGRFGECGMSTYNESYDRHCAMPPCSLCYYRRIGVVVMEKWPTHFRATSPSPLFYHRSIELVANSSIYFSFFYCFYFSSLRSSFRDKFLIRRANFNFSIRRKGILLLSSFRTTFSFLSHVFQLKFESKQISKKISNTKFQKSFITYLQTCGHFHLFSVYQIIPPGVHVRFIDVT